MGKCYYCDFSTWLNALEIKPDIPGVWTLKDISPYTVLKSSSEIPITNPNSPIFYCILTYCYWLIYLLEVWHIYCMMLTFDRTNAIWMTSFRCVDKVGGGRLPLRLIQILPHTVQNTCSHMWCILLLIIPHFLVLTSPEMSKHLKKCTGILDWQL